VSRWHVFRDGRVSPGGVDTVMRSNPPVVVEDLNGRLGGSDVDLFVDEGVGDAVVVLSNSTW